MQENILVQWLLRRGITESVLSQFGVTTGEHPVLGEAIHIPVHNMSGTILFKKYRRNPYDDTDGPKYMYDKGSYSYLYGMWHAKKHDRILITEGELDALVAWSHNVPAVSSTGGCMTFKEEWLEWMGDRQVLICLDNDAPGSEAAAKLLQKIPHAAVVFIPQRPNIKDLTDYAMHGGNIPELLRTAKVFDSLEAVRDDKAQRESVFEDTAFHDAYIRLMTPKPPVKAQKPIDDTRLARAKAYPIPNIIKVNSQNKALCVWHNEDTPSMHYYRKTNSVYCFGCSNHGDALDVYRAVHNCSFRTALNALAP